ncbi:transmembrane protein 6/97 [Scheffersomyces xylosifermentans]|uniref:transmembrane protein 6/97 n=1 Tax=Scheffersomyces xylosifermentans TaxID=1304137 RepID=UPI00315D029F
MISLDTFYLAYYILHIPITVLIDSTIVTPSSYQLDISKNILAFHIQQNRDFLLVETPLWFKLFGLVELVFQLPLFFYFSYQILRKNTSNANYLVLSVIYGFNAAFTTFICIGYALIEGEAHGLSSAQAFQLAAVYVPYLVIPSLILLDSAWRITGLVKKSKLD